MPTALHALPPITDQVERLLELGVHRLGGQSADELRAALPRDQPSGALLVLTTVPASALAPLMLRGDRPGFVVVDMTDVDSFAPVEQAPVPERPLYVVHGLDRGDAMSDWSPDEALPAITSAGRTPLTLIEGIHWVLQQPDVLDRNHCFMTIGSRLRRPDGRPDARTPAIWISNGTGRDGRERRDAAKVGWCWAGNRHTWLGIASAAGRC